MNMDYFIDAKGKRLGRVASEIATILQGKRSASYEPRITGTDRVFLSNCRAITVSGNKYEEKRYYRHTGYIGHLKSLSFKEAFGRNPQRVVREAVRRMLPKNALNPRRLKNLIFVESEK